MPAVIGEILPYALGIALSPVPIMGVILMLQSARARATGLAFLGGWVAGILLGVIVFEILSGLIIPSTDDGPRPVVGVLQLALGALLLVLALRKWRSRPRDGEEPELPSWMAGVDTMTPARAVTLGFVLAAANPKNLLLIVAAGVAIGGSGLTIGQEVVATAIFLVIASATVVLPVVGVLVAGDRLRPLLGRVHAWLGTNNATVMAVLFLVIGVVIIGNGLGNL